VTETKDNFNVVSGSIEDPGDLSFAFYVNDEIVLEAPSKESNLALSEKSNCNNGVTVSWNVESWNASVDYSNYKQEKTSKTKCNLFFREAMYSDYVTSCGENGNTAVDCMKKYSDKDTINLVYDETVDNNLRYIGADPNNYVSFNNELWRIIGVMENIDDGTGKKDARIKLIRNESIGNYSWDSSAANINGGHGIGEWSTADLNKLLNSYYYNSQSNQTCFYGRGDAYTTCDFSEIGLTTNTKNMIDTVRWDTGTMGGECPNQKNLLATTFYDIERNDTHNKIECSIKRLCNDSITRTSTWIGNIGLIYPSDYGYATNEERCLNTPLNNLNSTNCLANNWIYRLDAYQHTMTPAPCTEPDGTFCVPNSNSHRIHNGSVIILVTADDSTVHPALYLKQRIQIIAGKGTINTPYILA